MSEDSSFDTDEETDLAHLIGRELANEVDNNEHQWGIEKLMPDLSFYDQELSTDMIKKMTTRFSEVFANRYSVSGPEFYTGSLDEAMMTSLYNPNHPRSLIIYIHHDESVGENIFSKYICSPEIVRYLKEYFIVWPWDRTNINNYYMLLTMLMKNVNNKITSKIAAYSYSFDEYPLLVCLSFEEGEVTITEIINSTTSEDAVLKTLCSASQKFDFRVEEPNQTGQSLDRKWYIPKSYLTTIDQQSDEFRKIANDLKLDSQQNIKIEKIENIIWFLQYSSEKKKIYDRSKAGQYERELFYGCPLSMAQYILNYGFNYDLNRIHGDKYGDGFYFSTDRTTCEKYTVSDELKNDRTAIIACRVLVDNNFLRQSDSKSNEYDSNFFVCHRNEQILPEYLVTYTKQI